MIKGIHIHIDNQNELDALFSTASQINSKNAANALPNTANALFFAATSIQNAWKNWANGGQIPNVKNIPRPSEGVRDSIKKTPDEARLSDYEIYSENPYMVQLQNGADYTIDMKAPGSPWLNGKKSRVNKKDGSPYLIVPFSWGTPGKTGGSAHFRSVVPGGIMRALERRALTVNLGMLHTEKNVCGEDIPRNDYNWGGRISEVDTARYKVNDKVAAANGVSADEVRRRAVGMVRMWDSSYGENGNHGTYWTFRVISAKSAANKWIQHRHIEPHDVTGALKREFEGMIQQSINEAFRADLPTLDL